MPIGLERRQSTGQTHFITFSCHRRLPYLATSEAKQTFLQVLEKTRRNHRFSIYGFVLMPEHVHILLSEPDSGILSSSIRVLMGETSKLLKNGRDHFWQPRYYDFNVFTTAKFIEKLRYIHRNPVTRGIVSRPEEYPWSSFNHYDTGQVNAVEIESERTVQNRERAATVSSQDR